MMKLTYQQIQELKSKYKNNVSLRLNKCSIVKTCEWCGNLYTPTHHRQKFCTKKCYREHRIDYKNEWDRTKRKRKPHQTLGTGYIKSSRNEDFNREHEILTKEMRRLGIHRKR